MTNDDKKQLDLDLWMDHLRQKDERDEKPGLAALMEFSNDVKKRHNILHVDTYYELQYDKLCFLYGKLAFETKRGQLLDSHLCSLLFDCRTSCANLDRVYLSTSSVHGFGVFSKSEAKAGDILTYYPCDMLEVRGSRYSKGESETIVRKGEPNITSEDLNRTDDYITHFQRVKGADLSVRGDPAKVRQNGCLGHMINDGCEQNPMKVEESAYKTQASQTTNVNVVLGTCYIAIVAIRDIAPQQELFTSYGYSYWSDRRKRLGEDPTMPVLVCEACNRKSNGHWKCGRCKRVYYCNKTCQRSHWSCHKQNCRSIA